MFPIGKCRFPRKHLSDSISYCGAGAEAGKEEMLRKRVISEPNTILSPTTPRLRNDVHRTFQSYFPLKNSTSQLQKDHAARRLSNAIPTVKRWAVQAKQPSSPERPSPLAKGRLRSQDPDAHLPRSRGFSRGLPPLLSPLTSPV